MVDETPMTPKEDPRMQLTPIAWFDAAVMRGLLAALAALIGTVATLFFGVDETDFNTKSEKLVGAITSFVVIALPLAYTFWARMHRPTPPLAANREAAEQKKVEMTERGILPPSNTGV